MILYLILLIIILYLVAIMPKMIYRRDFTPFEGIFYAHRGLHNNQSKLPENSLSAFKLAIDNIYGIELDVRLTKDNIPIVFHDASLKRVCGLDKNVRDVTFSELEHLNLFNSNERIPLFKEVLNLIDGKVPIIVELKPNGSDTLICDIVANILDNYKGVYCIESFDPIIIHWYKKNRPNIIRGQLSTNYFKDEIKKSKPLNFLLQNLMFNFLTKPDFIAFNHKYSNMLSYKICKSIYRIPTFAYTIESKVELKKNIDNFDYFIFEGFIPEEINSKIY